MLFELKSVFQNDGETKELCYKLDMADIDIDGVFPFKTPVSVTAKAHNRASLITLDINCKFDYTRFCDRCGKEFTRQMDMNFSHKLAQTLVDDGNGDYIETPDFKLELDEVIVTDILLSLPQKNLCRRGNVPVTSGILTQGLRVLNSLLTKRYNIRRSL